jgi:ATP-dependent 26S proteasome regulatory subunit
MLSLKWTKISDEQLKQIMILAKNFYGENIDKKNNYLYPPINGTGYNNKTDDRMVGYHFGRNKNKIDRTDTGLLLFRKINRSLSAGVRANVSQDWFTKKTLVDVVGKEHKCNKYIIELREEGIYQSDGQKIIKGPTQIELAEIILKLSLILANKKDDLGKELTHEIYHKMNQIGLGKKINLVGLEKQLESVEKAMIIPLANPKLADSLKIESRSVGLIGQMGTGKTEVIKELLRRDYNLLLVPVNALDLEVDLNNKQENRKLIPKIKEIAEKTGKVVVLIVEDIDLLANKKNPTSNITLNELAGVYESGFRILWTTNYPEEINPQLMEPQRLGGKLICFNLPNEEARKQILSEHLVSASKNENIPVFPSIDEDGHILSSGAVRDKILSVIAKEAINFTPRYLKLIIDEATSNFMMRIIKEKKQKVGLEENDIKGMYFSSEDWFNAYTVARDRCDPNSRALEDKKIKKFIELKRGSVMGFDNASNKDGNNVNIRRNLDFLG